MTFSPKTVPRSAKDVSTQVARGREAAFSRRMSLGRKVRKQAGTTAQPVRASRVLRDFLARNKDVERFTVQEIVSSIEYAGPAASLMMFAIPAIVPVPGTYDLVGLPTMAMSSVLVSGRQTVRLPQSLLERSVPRRALALAIHAALPVLERAEKITKKRWTWLCTPAAQRIIGVLVFLLALPLAFPILGFGLPHATSLFTISLGMMEKDGATIALGVVAGIASLVFFTARGLSPRALAEKASDWLKRFVSQLTSVRKAAVAIFKRAWHWFSIKLLSGRRRAAPQNARQQSLRIIPDMPPLPLATTHLDPVVRESRLASMAAV